MELPPNVDESAIINDTPEQVDTWNQPRSVEALQKFVTDRLVRIGDFIEDDLF
jgi:hypothetical protein